MYYDLINYFDVWGNNKDGYDVNDLCVQESGLFIADDATSKDIANFLVRIGFLNTSDLRRIRIIDNCDGMIEIEAVKDNYPIGRLQAIYN